MEERDLTLPPINCPPSAFYPNNKSSVNRILIIRPGALGDVIVTLPVFEAIRNYFHDAQIEIMGYSSFLEIVNGRFYADTISRFDHAEISSLFMENSRIPASLTKRLKGIDLVISFVADKEKIVVKNLRTAGVRNVIHYEPFPSEGENVHMIDHLLKCLDLLGIPYANRIPKIFLKDEDILSGENFVKNNMAVPGKKLVALHPGSGSRKKCWPIDCYDKLISWLHTVKDVQVLLISGYADTGIVEELRVRGNDVFVLVDNLPLSVLSAVIKQCNFFVGNDSGITHLSSAVGTPTIAIFGSTSPYVWGPRGENVKILYKKSHCSPCMPETRNNCVSHNCFEDILVEDVIREAEYILC